MSKLLLFDLDGTLISTGGAGKRAIENMFLERYGIKNALQGIEGRGRTDPAIFVDVLRQKIGREPDSGELEKLIEVYPNFLRPQVETSSGYKLLGGIQDFLETVAKIPGVYLALGTGNLENGARIKLERSGLNRFFPVGGFSTDSIERPQLIARASVKAEKHYRQKFIKDDIFVIGDTVLDIAAARACGFKSAAVGCGMAGKEELLKAKPDFYFEDYSNPREWIKQLGLT
ncbi:MAG: HAD hydrolase-like protein [Elusimicrobia bacterium]|nr:HAD hydrolase-like protein [Elusimicrobiota bacterium]